MRNTTTFKELIQSLLDGETEGISATKTLKIIGKQLIHYNTPIAERHDGKFLINISRYSLETGQLQKQLRNMIPDEQQIIVKRVPVDYDGSLADFIESKEHSKPDK